MKLPDKLKDKTFIPIISKSDDGKWSTFKYSVASILRDKVHGKKYKGVKTDFSQN